MEHQENEEQAFEKLWNFISEFMKKYREEQIKLPYHINLIDELNANENAHSRILAKLLQQKLPNDEFEILKSFIQYLKDKEKSGCFGNINIENPEITQETERIDLWIRDKKNYAIIIENKIHYAGDQERQLERYIDKTRENFNNKQIFVVYLSPQGEEPDEQSWGKYKDEFQERYLNLSFKYDVLFWLKEKVLPNVRLKDVFLRSAIEQYIDHLEGMFSLRTINNKMNMDIQEFIKQELKLNGISQEEIVKSLSKKIEEIENVEEQLQLLKDNAEKEIFQKWQKSLKEKYPRYKEITISGAGLIIPINDTEVRVNTSFDNQLYCQVDTYHLESEKLPQEVIEKVGHILRRRDKKDNPSAIWKYFPRDAYDDTYSLLIKVIELLIN